MDDKAKFDFLFNKSREEEKSYLFNEDDDEEKITFNGRPDRDFDFFFEVENDDCSDWDKECKSKLLADLPTNDSNSFIWEYDYEDDFKFLSRNGLLEMVDEDDLFLIKDVSPSSPFEICDDFKLYHPEIEVRLSQNSIQKVSDSFLEKNEAIGSLAKLSPKEKELIEDGLPLLKLDEDEHQVFSDLREESRNLHHDVATLCHSNDDNKHNDNSEEIITTNAQSKKKSTEFNNMLERKAFRMMRKYYKSTFESFAAPFQYKKNVRIMNPEEMDSLVAKYMKIELNFLADLLAANEMFQMVTCLKRIILSDRYNKCERVTKDLDFTTTRNLFNKYCTRSLNEFISIPSNSILFIHFYLKQGRLLVQTQQDVDKQRLEKQIQCVVKLAYHNLPPAFRELYNQAFPQMLN